MFLVINIIAHKYRSKISKFLAASDCGNRDSEEVVVENEIVFKQIKKLQMLVVATLTKADDILTFREIPHIINIISLLTRMDISSDQLSEMQAWLRRICVEHVIDDVTVAKCFTSFLLNLSTRCCSRLTVEKDMAADIHKELGDIDEDIEMTGDKSFGIVNTRTAAPCVMTVLLCEIEKILLEIDWVLSRLKSETSTVFAENEKDIEKNDTSSPPSQTNTLDKEVCFRVTNVIHVFHELVQSAVPVGSCSELLLKALTKLYTMLGDFAKYYLFVYSRKIGCASVSFEKMVLLKRKGHLVYS